MAVYDLEEQEQLEELKAWWRRWGNLVTTVVVALSLAVIGVQGWRWYQHRQAEQASTLYSAAMLGVRGNDLNKARDAVTQLTDRYGGTTYASSGAMLLARLLFDKGDKTGAATQLQWVVDHGEEEARQVARFRLAEVQLDAKQCDDALRTLDAKHDASFDGLYADLRGDILAAAGRAGEARAGISGRGGEARRQVAVSELRAGGARRPRWRDRQPVADRNRDSTSAIPAASPASDAGTASTTPAHPLHLSRPLHHRRCPPRLPLPPTPHLPE